MTKTLKDTLKEIQIVLGKPHRKVLGAFKYYLSFLNPTEIIKSEGSPSSKIEKIQSIRHGKITWIDVKNPTRKEISWLAEEYPFHPLHLEDCISKGQFPKIEQNDEDKYLFMLLRLPHLNISEGVITIHQICFFLGKDYLITIHENESDTISGMLEDCKDNAAQRKAYINNSSAHLLYTTVERLTDDLSPLLQKILTEVDEAEDIVFDDKISGVYKVGQLRRKIVSLRRVIGPLRILLEELKGRINKFSQRDLSVYFVDIIHRVDKTWETLEEARETVDIYKDADFIASSEKTNRILAVLTLIFTLSIPATVIGSFYGMNIMLPGGLDSGPWTFWGNYTTLILIISGAVTFALSMLWYFKKKGWF
ncbi:MAG: magnesium transporter CorA family protein [Candidatus Daviesbacteria bacterium]|nr:magnesium transporter CorA family protein [Candidatus Daviesbacteria bacterium]